MNALKGYWTQAPDYKENVEIIRTDSLRIKVIPRMSHGKDFIRIDYAPNNYKVWEVSEFINLLEKFI